MPKEVHDHPAGLATRSSHDITSMSAEDTVLNGFFSVDRNWKIVEWNKAAAQILSRDAAEVLGTLIDIKLLESLPVSLFADYKEMLRHNEPPCYYRNLGPAGSWAEVAVFYTGERMSLSFKCTAEANTSPGSAVAQSLAMQLKTINDLYRSVTEITNDCLWEWNMSQQQVFWIDGGHRRHFGYQFENMLIPFNFWLSKIHIDDRAGVKSSLDQSAADSQVALWEAEYRFETAEGDYVHVQDRAQIIRNRQGRAVRMVGATCNIHKRKTLESTLDLERASRQRELTSAILAAQENERSEIGEELQDNLNQILAAVKMQIQMAQRSASNGEHLEKSIFYISQVIEEMRRISKKIVIPSTHIIGLSDNIRNLLADAAKNNHVTISYSINGITDSDITDPLQLTIFRIIQEQVSNILRHSSATQAAISLGSRGSDIVLQIADNGQGCDLQKERKGFGLMNIQTRAELNHGSVSIISSPSHGFDLTVSLNKGKG